MRVETIATLKAIVAADTTTTPEEQRAILAAFVNASGKRKRETGTIADAAEILGVHRRTVGLYAKRGLLHQIRITPRKIRYDLAEVKALAGVEYVEAANA